MKDDEYEFPKDEYLAHGDDNFLESAHDDEHQSENENENGPENEPENESQEVMSDGSSRWEFLKNKKIIGVILLVVIVGVGLKLMHHSTTTPISPAPISEPPPPPVTAAPSPPPVFTPPAPPENISSSPVVLDMQNRLADMRQQLNAVVDSGTQLSQSVSSLAAQVATLTTAVQETTQKLTALTAKRVAARRHIYRPPPITYVLKAIVPGRAWLLGSNGISINVTVGNYLSNRYGSVQSLNADDGEVITTSGKIISYGANDS